MKEKFFGVLQRVGRSFMLPIAILPVAGLLLGLGSSFTNETTLATYNLLGLMGPGTVPYFIFSVLSKCGGVIFDNLPLIFAIGVAIGMARQEKEVAALAAAVSFLVMHSSISAMISLTGGVENLLEGSTATVLGITSLQMGAFGGIIVGLGVAALHNRFYKIQLPQVLSFFGGTRFVPIISTLVFALVGILMFFVWQPIQEGINALGMVVYSSGYFGTFLFGMIKRLLIPFGLHHVFYLPFWQTAVGGTMEVAGTMVAGAQNIFFAQLADPTVTHFSTAGTWCFTGEFVLYIFGFPGAALAMYRCAKPERKKQVGGLLLSAALTSILTGITEPLEFSFLFVAPVLFIISSVFAGLAYMLCHILNITVGLTFSGGFIDLALFGILQGNEKTSWLLIIPLGIVFFLVYYFVFSFLIKKFNFKTPGRRRATRRPSCTPRPTTTPARSRAGRTRCPPPSPRAWAALPISPMWTAAPPACAALSMTHPRWTSRCSNPPVLPASFKRARASKWSMGLRSISSRPTWRTTCVPALPERSRPPFRPSPRARRRASPSTALCCALSSSAAPSTGSPPPSPHPLTRPLRRR